MARHSHVPDSTTRRRRPQNARVRLCSGPEECRLNVKPSLYDGVVPYSSSEFRIENEPEVETNIGLQKTSNLQTSNLQTSNLRNKNLKQYVSKGKVYRYHYPSRIPITACPGTADFNKQMASAEARYRERLSRLSIGSPSVVDKRRSGP
jgi:hypothetical protein